MEKLTAKEEEVMQVLWKMEPCYVKDMVPQFTEPPLHYNTVSTIVRNLEEKGYVGHRAYGNTHEYYAIVGKEDYQNRFVLKKVVGEYFDDSYKNLVSYFAQHEKISADELREILAMIEQKNSGMETLRYLVLVNGLLAVVSLAYYVLLRHETFFGANRLALWAGLAGALVLPLLELPDWRPQPVRTVMQRTAQVIVPRVLPNSIQRQPELTIMFPNGQTYPAFATKRTQPFIWSWQAGLVALYAAGVLLLLIRFGIQLTTLVKLIRRSAHEAYDGFTLVRDEGIRSPFSFFSWVVLNPDQHTVEELEQILRHERVHIRAGHSLDRIGAELVCIVFWFNPAAYLFRHLLGQTLEFSADRAVLAEGVDALAYQYNLVKVSLSAGQSALTNHFSKSQLKTRIAMLNKPESSKTTWLKYPVLFIAALTVATAFARPSVQTLKKFVPQPIAETIGQVTETVTTHPLPTTEPTSSTDDLVAVSATTGDAVSESATKPSATSEDFISQVSQPDSVQKSPSRYMVYQGDYLYWIVTPKTTIDEFAVMKQEFAEQGYKFQLNELKYDPFNAFIIRIAFKIQASNGDVLYKNETHNDLKPIPIIAEYVSIKGTEGDLAGSSRLEDHYRKVISHGIGRPPTLTETPPLTERDFPNVLRQVAVDDEALTYQFIDDRKMEYLILAGERKHGHLGMGFRKFNKEEIKKQSSPNSSISVKPDGSIVINEAPGEIIKTFINNEPATVDAIQRLKITQLYTVALILGYDNAAQKRTMTDYLLFYVNEAN